MIIYQGVLKIEYKIFLQLIDNKKKRWSPYILDKFRKSKKVKAILKLYPNYKTCEQLEFRYKLLAGYIDSWVHGFCLSSNFDPRK